MLTSTMTQPQSSVKLCSLPFCQFCTVQTKPTRRRHHRRSRQNKPRACRNCGAQSHTVETCPIWCELCHQSSHPTWMHRCSYCGRQGQHNARFCPDALHYMCQIENLKGVRKLRYPFQVKTGNRELRPIYKFDTRCLNISIDFNNYELYQMIIDSCDLTTLEILGVAIERSAWDWCMSILRSGTIKAEDLSSSIGRQLILAAFNDYSKREDLALCWLEAGGDPNMVVYGQSLLQHAKSYYFEAFAKSLIDHGASKEPSVDVDVDQHQLNAFDLVEFLDVHHVEDVRDVDIIAGQRGIIMHIIGNAFVVKPLALNDETAAPRELVVVTKDRVKHITDEPLPEWAIKAKEKRMRGEEGSSDDEMISL